MSEILFSPFQLSDLTLANRIIMAPMTRSRAYPDGTPGKLTAKYYVQRASAGLIISEAINISADAVGSPLTPGLFNDEHISTWKRVTDAVHAAGGKIFAQLWHTGRVGHSKVRDGTLPVAPSAISIQGQKHFTGAEMSDFEVPRELTTEQVRATVVDFGRAAAKAKAAGFDGVELHAATGYLPHQFLVDGSNQRADEYGGSIAKRCRFILEVLEELIFVWGKHRVGVRFSPPGSYNDVVDSKPVATFTHLLTELDTLNLAYVHLINSASASDDLLGIFRRLLRCPIISNGGYDKVKADMEINAGRADLISFGTLFVSNPDLPERLKVSASLVQPDRGTLYGGGAKGYTDYPPMNSNN